MFKNILLALDGSAYTEPILQMGIKLSLALDSHLTVITVADIRMFRWVAAVGADGFVPLLPTDSYESESNDLLKEKCEKKLSRASDILAESQCDFSLEMFNGAPAEKILEKSQVADLVIIGRQGEFSSIDQKSLGGTVETVTRAVSKPVIVVHKDHPEISSFVVAYDGSQHANHALQVTGHLAEAFYSLVHILCINNDPETAHFFCREAADYLKNYDIDIEIHQLNGHPGEEIVKFAKQNKTDFITMGGYGHSRIREALLGSTTEQILRWAPCNIMLAK